ELRCTLTRCVAVEPSNVRVRQGVDSRKQQQRILGRFPECFSLFDQQNCPLRRGLGFWRRLPFDMHQWVKKRNLKLDFFATKRRRAAQRRYLSKRTGELLDGLNQRRALQ